MHEFPLLNKISEIVTQDIAGFHTPGHQQGRGICKELTGILQGSGLKADLTELPGLDNLKKPQGCLEESQGLAARLFGACKTFFLVNGSTLGLQAALLALSHPGGRVVLTRQAHISLINGMVLTGGIPVPLAVDIDETWGIPLGISPDKLRRFLAQSNGCDAIVITQPNYQGVAGNAREITSLCREHKLPLIVDEAHGAHLYFQDKLPVSAQRAGADIVVQSTHKTLNAFTQASMLHINNIDWLKPVEGAIDILQTSSPSYLLLASLDGVQGQMRARGFEIVTNTLELARELRRSIEEIKGYRLFNAGVKKDFFQDPTKLVLSAAELGISGWELGDVLKNKYGIFVEYSAYYYVLLMVTPGHGKEDSKILLRALKDIAGSEKKNKHITCGEYISLYKDDVPVVLSPRQVYYQVREEVAAETAAGRIAGRPLTIYPPGIPLVWPGQILQDEHLEYLKWAAGQGLPVQGLTADGRITVVIEAFEGGVGS